MRADSQAPQGNQERPATAEAGLSRRRLLEGSAWAVPVIAIAAATPSQAASNCALYPGVVIFSGPNANFGPNGPGIDAQGSVNLDGAPVWTHPPVRIGVESFPVGPLQRGPENLTTADDALLVTQYPIGEPDGFAEQDLVITFGREVTDLAFTVGGINTLSGAGGYADAVSLDFTPGATAVTGSNVGGTGDFGTPWSAIAATATPDVSSPANSVRLTFTSQVTTLVLRFRSTDLSPAATGTQRFTISDMSFKAGCGIGSA